MSSITKDDVLKLAKLSRLQLSDEEVARYQKELESILHYVDKLQAVDTDDLEPTYQVTGLKNVVRPDEIIDYGTDKESLLKNAPDRDGDYFKVERMVG